MLGTREKKSRVGGVGAVKTGHGCYSINRVVSVGITEVRLEQRLEGFWGFHSYYFSYIFAIFHLKDI